jgi:FkbM family methyltransferase
VFTADSLGARIILKQFLKHNRLFRKIFAWPLTARSRWINRRASACAALYRQTIAGGEVIVCPANIPGKFVVPARSDLAVRIITRGCYEPEVTERLRRLTFLAGDIVNIGANVGLHAVFLARQCSNATKIYAVEPNPEAYGYLTRNVSLNGMQERITAIQACIGATAGEMDFALIPGMPEYSSLGGIVHSCVRGRPQTTIRVPVSPLHVAIGDPGFEPSLLLVDAEGAELLVFQGASPLLTRHRPLLVFECSDPLLQKFGHSSKRVVEFLQSHDYAVRDAAAPRLALQHPFDDEAIAVPRENLDRLLRLIA